MAMAVIVPGDRLLLYGGHWSEQMGPMSSITFHDTDEFRLKEKIWMNVPTPIAPQERYCHAAAPLGPKSFLMFGGFDGTLSWNAYVPGEPYGYYSKNVLGDTWIYDIVAKDWTNNTLTSTGIKQFESPTPRSDHAMAQLRPGLVVLFGGSDSNQIARNDTWMFFGKSPIYKSGEWTQLTVPVHPLARSNHGMASLTQNTVLLFGGVSSKGVTRIKTFKGNKKKPTNASLCPPVLLRRLQK